MTTESERIKKIKAKSDKAKGDAEPDVDCVSICQGLEACRKLKDQYIEEATKQFPFKGEHGSREKLQRYIKLLNTLDSMYEAEEELLDKFSARGR